MTTRKYTSRSQQTTLTSAVTSGALTFPVVSATTLLGGATVSTGQTFTIVVDPDTALEEVVDVTVVSGNNLTVTRAIDGSGAQDHSSGAVIRHMIIGRDLREANTHIEATNGVHGLASTSSVVGTQDTQTLYNKTLIAPTLTSTLENDSGITFEGATADAYETFLTVIDPTQDNTITLPNTSGTIVLLDATQTLTNKTLTSPTISGTPVITGLSSTGMSTTSATPKNYVDSILGSATAASTSATSAANSATAAATSASSASTSASSALTSQSAAATSATSAAASATAAATSATSAAASATAAATSATSASSYVSTVAASATAAATSAASAATSASSSLTSANSAATSASSALTSQTAAATSATSAATSATSAATTYTAYDVRYLGSKASAPTLNNQGGALIIGATYWDTSTTTMYVWTGSAWNAISSASAVTSVSGTAGNVVVTGTTAPTINLATAGTAGTYGYINSMTTDTYGRVTSVTAGTTSGSGAHVLATGPTISNITLSGTLTASATSGTNGQYLQSTGSGIQWGSVTTDPNPQIMMLMGA